MSRRLLNLINNNSSNLPLNKKFACDVMSAIERSEVLHRRKGSNYYKPSSLHCLRDMYFTRMGAEQDTTTESYGSIGMADTGTRRHEAIQEVLLQMKELGYDWEYVDVADYVQKKQKFGKCTTVSILGKAGAETHLTDSFLHISFRCDGIIRRISTNEYFLFEFKNQASFKYSGKECVDVQHIEQVTCYCTALDLDKAFVLYENRDNCELCCPEVFEVTQDMKEQICINKILECESYVERMIAPPKCDDNRNCKWCKHKTICKKVG